MRHFIYILLFLLPILSGKSQTPEKPLFFSTLNAQNGLSQNCVTSICQDSTGYLWFGTYDGLNRFDGYGFTVYRNNNLDSNSLDHNQIREIVSGSQNSLWVLTGGGLNRLDNRTGQFHRYPLGEKALQLHATATGEILLLSSRTLYRYLPAADSFAPAVTSPHPFTALAENRKGQIYIGTRNRGILVYSPAFQPAGHLENIAGFPSGKAVTRLHSDSQGQLWAVAGNTIGRFDTLFQTFTPIPPGGQAMIDKTIRAVIDLDSSHLLFGTFNGLFLIDKTTGEVTSASPSTGQPGELSHFSIYSLGKDCQGNLWVGTNNGGINLHTGYNDRFRLIQPERFSGMIGTGTEDSRGRFWFSTEGGGLLSYDPATGQQHNYLLSDDSRQAYNSNIIKALLLSGDTLFCSTHEGKVFRFSIPGQQFTLLKDFRYNNINSLYKDSQGGLWIPTNTSKGLVRLHNGEETATFPANGGEKRFSSVSAITETTPGTLLIGTENDGFYRYDLNTGELTHISASHFGLPENTRVSVTAFYIDSLQNIWTGTAGNGFFVFGPNLERQPSLWNLPGPEEKITFITESPRDYFWIATTRQLYRYHRPSGEVLHFDAANGMPFQDFSPGAGLLTRNGHLYLPGNKGITVTDTRHFPVNGSRPPVVLTGLRIDNREVTPAPHNSPLRQPLANTATLTLRPGETNIAIGYTALNYIYPSGNRYAYRMEGIDPDWVQAGGRREAIYSNLPPGNYTFRVKASNDDGVWNDNGATLRIKVLAPLWLRWWAFLLYALAAFLILRQYFIYRQRKQTLEHQLRYKQLEQEKAEEIHRERLRFFTQVAHEFRTPLTLILNPLDELSEKTVHISGIGNTLTLIRQNTRRLLSLVNNLLDLQKQESGKTELHYSVFDLHEFMQELYYNFQSVAQNRTIDFRLQLPNRSFPVEYDRGELEKVIFNLLSNAFKFTPENGTITLSATLRPAETERETDTPVPQNLCIEVEDNGIGIRKEDREKLFQPFSTSGKDLHGELLGSGIGLSVARSIVLRHKGTLTLREASPQGTVADICLPYIPITAAIPATVSPETDEEETTATSPVTPFTPTAPRTHALLLIDDNRDILTYLKNRLEQEYIIYTAENAEEALAIAGRQTVHLIVSDVMMPGIDGNQFCRTVKSTPALSHIPVILLTAKTMTAHMEEGFDAGADDYLTKPFKISALKARIRNILAERERLKKIYSKKLSLESAGIEVTPDDRAFMEKYTAIVRENISNPDFNIETLCTRLGMSRAAFYRKTKTLTTLSPAEMIRNIRLECAAGLLKTTALSAAEIAFQTGFGSYAHFSDYFKATYGVSPKEYRETGSGE